MTFPRAPIPLTNKELTKLMDEEKQRAQLLKLRETLKGQQMGWGLATFAASSLVLILWGHEHGFGINEALYSAYGAVLASSIARFIGFFAGDLAG